VRAELLRTLRDAHFRIGTEQLTLIEATRGGQLAVVAGVKPSRMPLRLTARLEPTEGGSRVVIDVAGRWHGPMGDGFGLREAYDEALRQVGERIERVLERLPADAASIPQANGAAPPAPIVLRETPPTSAAYIDSPKGQAVLELDELQALLTSGVLITSRPGAMPPALADQVERLIARLERALGPAPEPPVRLGIDEDEIPVFEFLRQQARIRAQLPLRTLEVCTTCRFEKVENPDYKRLMKRNRSIRNWLGSVGTFITPHGISPYVLLGRLVQFKQLDPDFVCPRCQGLEADPSLITFCPGCGDRRTEPVLRACPHCQHDFRAALAPQELWRDPVSPTPIAGALGAPPPPAPAWHADPFRRHELRYWDGVAWSDHVSDDGVVGHDPLTATIGPPAEPTHPQDHQPS
jgi:hypothetical protein